LRALCDIRVLGFPNASSVCFVTMPKGKTQPTTSPPKKETPFFRPAPLQPPSRPVSIAQYDAYLAAYKQYITQLSELRTAFWDEQRAKRASPIPKRAHSDAPTEIPGVASWRQSVTHSLPASTRAPSPAPSVASLVSTSSAFSATSHTTVERMERHVPAQGATPFPGDLLALRAHIAPHLEFAPPNRQDPTHFLYYVERKYQVQVQLKMFSIGEESGMTNQLVWTPVSGGITDAFPKVIRKFVISEGDYSVRATTAPTWKKLFPSLPTLWDAPGPAKAAPARSKGKGKAVNPAPPKGPTLVGADYGPSSQRSVPVKASGLTGASAPSPPSAKAALDKAARARAARRRYRARRAIRRLSERTARLEVTATYVHAKTSVAKASLSYANAVKKGLTANTKTRPSKPVAKAASTPVVQATPVPTPATIQPVGVGRR
jgi:hypothetical protein